MTLLPLEVVVNFFKIGMIVIKTKNMMMITRWSTTSPVRRTRCWNLGTQQTRRSPPGEPLPSLRIISKNETFRIAECSEVHSKLQAHFSLNLQEMYDLSKHINNIKNAIRAKQAPLKVAQTRLELRSHRPDAEATRDMPHVKLVQEVGDLLGHLDIVTITTITIYITAITIYITTITILITAITIITIFINCR